MKTVLIISFDFDDHADCVVSKLREHEIKIVRLNPISQFGEPFFFNPAMQECVIGGCHLNLASVVGVYCRIALENIENLFDENDPIKKFQIREEADAWRSILYQIDRSLWMNSPAEEILASCKPHSLAVARQANVSIPNFFITNVAEKVRHSAFTCAVVKQISDASIAYQNQQFMEFPDFDEFFVPVVSSCNLEAIDNASLNDTPTLFQYKIKRSTEYRVTIIGENVFTAKVNLQPQVTDIHEVKEPEYNLGQLDQKTSDSLLKLQRLLGLQNATYDLVEDSKGDVHLVDVNPQGNWLWLDELFDDQISSKICENLLSFDKIHTP